VVNPNGVRTNTGTFDRIKTHGRLVQKTLILDADKIAQIAVEGMLKGKRIIVPGFWNRCLLQITRPLPINFKIKKAAKIIRRELLQQD
jgi:hypothetical protein